MKLAKYLTSDESPLVLQIVVPVAPDVESLYRSVKALALLADQVCQPTLAVLYGSRPGAAQSAPVTMRSGALPAGMRRSTDRMKLMVDACGDDAVDVAAHGWDNVVLNGSRAERMHYSCMADADVTIVERSAAMYLRLQELGLAL